MIKKQIEENGCYLGHLSEIDNSLFEKLNVLKPLLNREYFTRVTHSYLGEYSDKIESTTTNSFEEAEAIKELWLSQKNKGKDVWQIFYTINNDNLEGSNILQNVFPIVKELFISILEYCYGKEISEKAWEIHRNVINVSNFTKGCFIEDHADGGSSRMICNILIYLNEEWEEDYGGELVLQNKFKQQPKWGNFAVLDFMKHNPIHSVTPIEKDNYNRFAILTGVLFDEKFV